MPCSFSTTGKNSIDDIKVIKVIKDLKVFKDLNDFSFTARRARGGAKIGAIKFLNIKFANYFVSLHL